MTNEEIIKQLVEFYYDEKAEFWHKERMSRMEAWRYHEDAIKNGNIITVSDGDILCGYIEFYRTHKTCFIHNAYIRPEYRNGDVAKKIKNRLFEVCKGFRVYHGNRDKHGSKYKELQLRRITK